MERARMPGERAERWGRSGMLLITGIGLLVASLGLGLLVSSGVARGLDLEAALTISGLLSTPLGPVLHAWDVLGELATSIGLTLAIALALLLEGRWRDARLVTLSLGAGLVSSGVKLLFQLPRPEGADITDLFGEPSFAYPSGHVVRTVVLLGVAALVLHHRGGPVARRLDLALVLAVGLGTTLMAVGRMAQGVHWLSDVVGGALLGVGWLAVTARFWPERLLRGDH